MKLQIYHNPRCSKSRATLELLHARGLEPQVIEYLKDPPSIEVLVLLAKALGCAPADMIRRNESAFSEAGLDGSDCSDSDIFAAIESHPILLQRPIVVADNRARIGRPPEAVLDIL